MSCASQFYPELFPSFLKETVEKVLEENPGISETKVKETVEAFNSILICKEENLPQKVKKVIGKFDLGLRYEKPLTNVSLLFRKECGSSPEAVATNDETEVECNAVRNEVNTEGVKAGVDLFIKNLADFEKLPCEERVIYMNLLRAVSGEDDLSAKTPVQGSEAPGPSATPAHSKPTHQYKKTNQKIGAPRRKTKKSRADPAESEVKEIIAESRKITKQLKHHKSVKNEKLSAKRPLVREFRDASASKEKNFFEKETPEGAGAAEQADAESQCR